MLGLLGLLGLSDGTRLISSEKLTGLAILQMKVESFEEFMASRTHILPVLDVSKTDCILFHVFLGICTNADQAV